MAKFKQFVPSGIMRAMLLMLNEDLSINDSATSKYTRGYALIPGASAVTVTGNASQVHACSFEEQQQTLKSKMDEIGDQCPVINGFYGDGSKESTRIAKMLHSGDASYLLVFPSITMCMGSQRKPEMAIAHFSEIANAADLPFICF